MVDRDVLEQALGELPLYQYLFLSSSELIFTERVRDICRTQCPMYGTNWACPPAVGTVDECRKRCLRFPHVLAITTATEVEDIASIEQTLATRGPHEDITRQVAALVKEQASEVMVLSTESCAHCKKCTYPDALCRFPDRMYPCVESHGILATDIADKCGLDFFNGNVVIWFSLIFYRD